MGEYSIIKLLQVDRYSWKFEYKLSKMIYFVRSPVLEMEEKNCIP